MFGMSFRTRQQKVPALKTCVHTCNGYYCPDLNNVCSQCRRCSVRCYSSALRSVHEAGGPETRYLLVRGFGRLQILVSLVGGGTVGASTKNSQRKGPISSRPVFARSCTTIPLAWLWGGAALNRWCFLRVMPRALVSCYPTYWDLHPFALSCTSVGPQHCLTADNCGVPLLALHSFCAQAIYRSNSPLDLFFTL